MLVKFV